MSEKFKTEIKVVFLRYDIDIMVCNFTIEELQKTEFYVDTRQPDFPQIEIGKTSIDHYFRFFRFNEEDYFSRFPATWSYKECAEFLGSFIEKDTKNHLSNMLHTEIVKFVPKFIDYLEEQLCSETDNKDIKNVAKTDNKTNIKNLAGLKIPKQKLKSVRFMSHL